MYVKTFVKSFFIKKNILKKEKIENTGYFSKYSPTQQISNSLKGLYLKGEENEWEY